MTSCGKNFRRSIVKHILLLFTTNLSHRSFKPLFTFFSSRALARIELLHQCPNIIHSFAYEVAVILGVLSLWIKFDWCISKEDSDSTDTISLWLWSNLLTHFHRDFIWKVFIPINWLAYAKKNQELNKHSVEIVEFRNKL